MKILVVAAHPDDEILGCGGTMAWHAQRGDEVHVVIMAEGITARNVVRDRSGDASELSRLSKAAHRANTFIGVSSLVLRDFPDNRLDSIDLLDIVKVVEEYVAFHNPDVVYTHHAGDVNVDHRCVHDAVIAACRPQPHCSVKQLLFFEVTSSTEWQPPHTAPYFMPTWFVTISQSLDLKLKALEEYESEMRDFPHPRSLKAIEYLARWRGATVGVEAAEAFVVGRNIIGKE